MTAPAGTLDVYRFRCHGKRQIVTVRARLGYGARAEAAQKLSRVHRRSVSPMDLIDANEKPAPDEDELDKVRGFARVKGPND